MISSLELQIAFLGAFWGEIQLSETSAFLPTLKMHKCSGYEQRNLFFQKIFQEIRLGSTFMVQVANFEPLYLRHLLVKIQSFCAHQTGNFLNFPKLTQLSSVAHFLRPLGAFEHKRAFFLGHPVHFQLRRRAALECLKCVSVSKLIFHLVMHL